MYVCKLCVQVTYVCKLRTYASYVCKLRVQVTYASYVCTSHVPSMFPGMPLGHMHTMNMRLLGNIPVMDIRDVMTYVPMSGAQNVTL